MKKTIETFPKINGKNFIYCFTSVYMFLEDIEITGSAQERCENGFPCCGCGGCGHYRTKYIQMFDTMCGHSATRCRYDGKLSEMQKLIGGHYNIKDNHVDCYTDYSVDFLFGFAGYEYHKCVDKSVFKNEITTAINNGVPVIAEILLNGSALYHVFSGNDGDMIIDSDVETVFKYDDFETIFIFGNKIAPRYSVRDGLERVKQVMKSNISEGVWDGYMEIFQNWVNFNEVDLAERKLRMQRLTDAMSYAFNIYPFNWAFWGSTTDVAPWTDKFKEMREPALTSNWKETGASIWEHLSARCDTIMWIGHTISFHLYYTIDWSVGNGNVLNGLYEIIWLAIGRVKEKETEILEYINQAIEILDSKGE